MTKIKRIFTLLGEEIEIEVEIEDLSEMVELSEIQPTEPNDDQGKNTPTDPSERGDTGCLPSPT